MTCSVIPKLQDPWMALIRATTDLFAAGGEEHIHICCDLLDQF